MPQKSKEYPLTPSPELNVLGLEPHVSNSPNSASNETSDEEGKLRALSAQNYHLRSGLLYCHPSRSHRSYTACENCPSPPQILITPWKR